MADWLTSEEREALDALNAGPINRLQQELLGEAVERLSGALRNSRREVAGSTPKLVAAEKRIEALEHLVSTQRSVAQAAHEECSRLRDERDTAWSANALGRKQVAELEFKNAQLRADCDFFERSRLEYKYRYEKACEAHGDMVDRYHEASKQEMLLLDRVGVLERTLARYKDERGPLADEMSSAMRRVREAAAKAYFGAPSTLDSSVAVRARDFSCGCTNGCAAWECKNT